MARRRLVAVAVAGALVLAGLTGCRSEPGSAAFVGGTRITVHTVDAMLDGLLVDGANVRESDKGAARQQITSVLTFLEVATRYAQSQGYPTPPAEYQALATQLGLPSSNGYVRAVAEAQAYQALLEQRATPVAVSDTEYGAIADRVNAQVGGAAGGRDEVVAQFKANFADQIGRAVAVRDELTKAIKQYDVTVNPLYAPAAWVLLQLQFKQTGQQVDLVVLPLTAGAGTPPAVTNVIVPR